MNAEQMDFLADKGKSFATTLLDGAPIAYDLSKGSKSLMIAFAGARHRFGMPNGKALHFFEGLKTNVIFLRDFKKLYGFRGFSGLGQDIDSVVNRLKTIIDDWKIENLVVTGTSMGGFLSLLFGILLRANTIHAFMPRTTVKLSDRYKERFKPRYTRLAWLWRFIRANYSGRYTPHYLDIQLLLEDQSDFHGNIYLHFNEKNKKDVFHAKRIELFRQTNLITYPGKMHNVIPLLLNSGELENIFAPLFTK